MVEEKLGGKSMKPVLSAFMLYAGLNRQRIWENNANASHVTLGKLIVDEWEQLSIEEREKYERLAIEDVANREKARMMHIAESEKRNGIKKKKKRDPRAPKAASVPYTFFFKEFRPQIKAQNQEASFSEIGKLLGAAWRNLSEEDRQIYNKMAEEDKFRYQEEMIAYEKDASAPAVTKPLSPVLSRESAQNSVVTRNPMQPVQNL